MEFINLSEQNIQDEHICCAFTSKESAEGYAKKKAWLKTQFKNGYTFRKLGVRGKVFIEYVPIEQSWLPLDGQNFMVINCFWVSGQFKGKGYGKQLLKQCITNATEQGMDGVIAVASDKKRPFMSDAKFFKHQGFEIVDEAPPFFKLWGLKLRPEADFPKFKTSAKTGTCPDKEGITVYHSNTCPFTEYYANEHLKKYANKKGIPFVKHHINSQADGHQMPIPWIINSVFYRGELVTLEVKADRHLDKIL